MQTFSPSYLQETRRLSTGNGTLFRSIDTRTQSSLLLRLVTTDEQVQRARDIGSYGIPEVAAYIDDFEVATGKVLVFYSPEQASDFIPLLPGDTVLTVPRVLQIGQSLIACLRGLNEKGYCLTMLFAEDILVSRATSRAYLINFDNVEPITGKASNRAEAHIAALLMQLTLNCSYEVVERCIRRGRDRRYRLYGFPKGTDKKVRQLVDTLVPPSVPRILRGSVPYAFAIAGVVAIVETVVHWPTPIAIEGSLIPLAVEEVTKKAGRKFRHSACLSILQNDVPGSCRRVDLSGADLSGKDLRGIVLSGSLLRGADLSGVNLSGVTLERVNVDGANLRNANLSGITAKAVTWGSANLEGAVLSEAHLTHSDFSDASLGEVDFSYADISHADLSGANLSNQVLLGVTAVETIFNHGNLHGVTLEGGSYIRARFHGTDMGSAVFTGDVFIDESKFKGVELAGSRFINAVVYSTLFDDANMDDVLIEGSDLQGTSFIDSDLDDARIRYSVLSGGRFKDSKLRNAVIFESLVQAMDFNDAKARGLEIINSDLSRSSNIPVYLFSNVRYENVVMPNGELRD